MQDTATKKKARADKAVAEAIGRVPGRLRDWVKPVLVAAVQEGAIPRDVAFDVERCRELNTSEKMQYFDGQKTRTFAEFWEQRGASKNTSGRNSKKNKRKEKEKEEKRIAAEMRRIESTLVYF